LSYSKTAAQALVAIDREQLDAISEEVVATSTRGKELVRRVTMLGAPGTSLADYELVTITQQILADELLEKRGLTITFKDSSCADALRKH